jgi:hypothetical protein
MINQVDVVDLSSMRSRSPNHISASTGYAVNADSYELEEDFRSKVDSRLSANPPTKASTLDKTRTKEVKDAEKMMALRHKARMPAILAPQQNSRSSKGRSSIAEYTEKNKEKEDGTEVCAYVFNTSKCLCKC